MADAVVGGRLSGAARSRRTRTQDASASSRPLPWGADDLLRWGITIGIGAIVVGVSWYVCAGEASFGQQVGPADAAIAGLLVAAVGNASWLLKGRRAVGERRRALLPDVEPAPVAPVHVGGTGSFVVEPESASETDRFVAGAGMERYHRADCALASGREGWESLTRDEHKAAGRRPCGVCRP
jgi:hypothetical protein